MNKIIIFISFFIITFLTASSAFASSGACSWHDGVDCSRGRQVDEKVYCNDGWTESITYYDYTIKCQTSDYCSNILNTTPSSEIRFLSQKEQEEFEKSEKYFYEKLKEVLDAKFKIVMQNLELSGRSAVSDVSRELKQAGLGGFVGSSEILEIAKARQQSSLVGQEVLQKKIDKIIQFAIYQRKNSIDGCPFKVALNECGKNTYYLNDQCTCNDNYKWNNDQKSCILNTSEIAIIENELGEIKNDLILKSDNSIIQEEKTLTTKLDKKIAKRMSGGILLQVEKNGEGWLFLLMIRKNII